MSTNIRSLFPTSVWNYFYEICQIPHDSGNEAQLRDAIQTWALKYDLKSDTDEAGNLAIFIPATEGLESAPTITLQAHLDMVCEKNRDRDFNFETDAIDAFIDGDWVTADGTTLGADNGIGLAMALAIMDERTQFPHGPLEILCTIDEETGLVGAMNLSPALIKGDILINTDSEDEGIFFLGCAGGFDCEMKLSVDREPGEESALVVDIQVANLLGGHSGMDINENRGNALKVLAATLKQLTGETSARLCAINGGDKHNAIPREAFATVRVAAAHRSKVAEILQENETAYNALLPSNGKIQISTLPPNNNEATPLTPGGQAQLLDLILALPHGVLAMSKELAGIVQSSHNVAKVTVTTHTADVLTSARSSHPKELEQIRLQLEAIGHMSGAETRTHTGYPPWVPNFDSPLVKPARELWKKTFGAEPEFMVIHAGFECGIIKAVYPNMEAISVGPDIESPHSPGERVRIASVERVYNFLKSFIEKLSAH